MKLAAADLHRLAGLAVSAATDAAQLIARSRPEVVETKAAGATLASQLVTEVDRRSEALVLDALSPTLDRFELGLLTEERVDDRSRLEADHFWCIDPLDGTLPFVEGSPGYAVSIALVAHDGRPLIGVVADPVTGTVSYAIAGAGAFRDGVRWTDAPTAAADVLSVFADRSFLGRDDHAALVDALDRIAHDLGLDGIEIDATAGAVMNAYRVLDHPPGCYVKPPVVEGGGSLWDFAATACLFHERGAVATDVRGAPLDLNRADATSLGHRGVLFASDDAVAERIRALDLG
ncbi:MAG: inositol monophosphatase family protein [Actinomycetota bacterium]